MLKGAIFDQDGLMFDTEAIFAKSWIEAGREMGFSVPKEFCTAVSGSSGENMERIIRAWFPHVDCQAYMKRLFEISYAAQDRYLPEKPGLHEILDFMRDNGVRLAIASSSHRERIEGNLLRAGIRDYFEVIVSREEVSAGKPDPEIFLRAAAELGLRPSECYVFEDSFNGIRAGHAAGCRTIMIPDLLMPDEEISSIYDGCAESLLDAMEMIRSGEL